MTTRATREFFLSRRATAITRLTVLVFGAALVWHAWLAFAGYTGRGPRLPWELATLAAVADGLFAAYCAGGLLRASRPVVRLDDRELEWGSVFAGSRRRRRLPLQAIREVVWQTPKRLHIETQAGDETVVRLAEIDAAGRQQLFEAIRQRIGPPV